MTKTNRYYKVHYQTPAMMTPYTKVYDNLEAAQALRDNIIRQDGYVRITSITCRMGSKADQYWNDFAGWTEYEDSVCRS